MSQIVDLLNTLIDSASILGLPQDDVNNAKEYLEYNEWGLCFDTVITQMSELDLIIDKQFYELVEKIGQKLELPEGDYSYMKGLIRTDNNRSQ